MGRNNYFQFKQFKIVQEQTAMKVGVDGVLLGAWVKTNSATNVLDVGTGTGLIALMLAQRSKATITGVEIEGKAAEEARFNVKASPWSDRVAIVHQSFQQFAARCPQKFDLVVSNPPFFKNSSKTPTPERTLARHNDALPFSELIGLSAELLTPRGSLALIIPADTYAEIEAIAARNRLFPQRITRVFPKISKPANRILAEFSSKPRKNIKNDLYIYHPDGSFTDEYIELTRAFYLKF